MVIARSAVKRSIVAALVLLMVGWLFVGQFVSKAHAEGTGQFNEMQALQDGTVLFADVLNAGETINISVCNDTSISIWDTNDTPADNSDDTALGLNVPFTANLSCSSPVPNPITGAFEYTPASTGTYRIQFGASQERYDFTVTPNASTNPNPTVAAGRIWSYEWVIDADAYAEANATNADLYILVPASQAGQDFVWKLDLNKFAGYAYSLVANSLGLDAPYSGLSAAGGASGITPEYRMYLGFPAVAGSAPTTTPTITNAHFIDDVGQDNVFSPNGTVGIQDSGNFVFNTNVNNANYAITIDTNQDGIYGTGDRLLLGKAQNGANTVSWDGDYPDGTPVTTGAYTAQIQIRTGEYHFIVNDVETSGGTNNGGTSWANGLTIYRATDANTTENTMVFWDDVTELSSLTGATANVPNGVMSGSTADANNDGRADGFHTWGNFTGSGLGNSNNIDTYTYGPSVTATAAITVAPDETGDNDGITPGIESGAPNGGDGNGDGTDDFLQNEVASLPNAVGGGYSTLAVSGGGCNALSNVAIYNENQLSVSDAVRDYPVGLFNFSINCGAPGATASVKVYYDKVYDTSTWDARKFINNAYSNISGAVFATETVGGVQVTTLSYSVTDGGALDDDGTANGTIVDPAGPGIVAGTSTTTASGAAGAPNTGLQRRDDLLPFVLIGVGLVTVSGLYIREKRQGTPATR